MSLRQRLSDDLKTAMKAGDAVTVSTVRMINARVKDADIAGRPRGVERIEDDEIVPLLRSMLKQRADAIALYRQGGREELAAREEEETRIIGRYLPASLDGARLAEAVDHAIAETGATTIKDMGRVMTALKTAHGPSLDMARANQEVRRKLA